MWTCPISMAMMFLLAGSRCARREPNRGSLAARGGELNPKLKRDRGYETMTVARELAEFLIRTSPSDIPQQPLDHAAMLIASTLASDAAASDDSDLRNIVHAGTTLAATSLAVAERTRAGGEEVLAAIVLGYEAAGRIGESITPGFRTRGFHGCLVAIFA